MDDSKFRGIGKRKLFFIDKFLSPLGFEPQTSHKPFPTLYHLCQSSRARGIWKGNMKESKHIKKQNYTFIKDLFIKLVDLVYNWSHNLDV